MELAPVVIGLVLVIVIAASASHASDGAWLLYFDGSAKPDRPKVDPGEQTEVGETSFRPAEDKDRANRIVALPYQSRTKTGVPGQRL